VNALELFGLLFEVSVICQNHSEIGCSLNV
jgi:hypothetical protein